MHVLHIAISFLVLLNSRVAQSGHCPCQHASSGARLLTEYHHFCCMCCSWGGHSEHTHQLHHRIESLSSIHYVQLKGS